MAVFESAEQLEAAAPRANKIKAGFGGFLAAPPNVGVMEVVAHIDNH